MEAAKRIVAAIDFSQHAVWAPSLVRGAAS